MKAKATDKNDNRGRAWRKPAAKAKEHHLRKGNMLTRKPGRDLAGMGEGMRVFKA
jgi:hypothetical protein